MSRVLVVGGSGFIGQCLVQNLIGSPQHQVSGTYNHYQPQLQGCQWYQASVTDNQKLGEVFRSVNPEHVLLLAAMADVVECENNPKQATEVNVEGAQNVAALCGQYEARLVFLSTEYVFDGKTGNYKEDAVPGPTSHYGQTKWEAEQTVAQYPGLWNIIRTSLVYGWHPRPDRANLVTRVINNISQGRPAYGFTDQYRSPVNVKDVAEGIIRVIDQEETGIFHVAGPDWIAMNQFVLAVAEQFELDSELVQQTPSTDRRPGRLGLDSTQSVEWLGWGPQDVASGLKDMRTNRRESA